MKNIYVGNLDFGATEDSIRSLFQPYGAPAGHVAVLPPASAFSIFTNIELGV